MSRKFYARSVPGSPSCSHRPLAANWPAAGSKLVDRSAVRLALIGPSDPTRDVLQVEVRHRARGRHVDSPCGVRRMIPGGFGRVAGAVHADPRVEIADVEEAAGLAGRILPASSPSDSFERIAAFRSIAMAPGAVATTIAVVVRRDRVPVVRDVRARHRAACGKGRSRAPDTKMPARPYSTAWYASPSVCSPAPAVFEAGLQLLCGGAELRETVEDLRYARLDRLHAAVDVADLR